MCDNPAPIDWDAELAKVHLPEEEEDKPKERTPEDTKRALHCCLVENEDVCECESCPYAVNGSSTWNCDVSVGQDALAYIEQLEQRVPRWISVEERYPEHRKLVLFGYAEQKYVSIGYFDEEGAEWCDTEDNEVVRPTHWMPWPGLPDNEKEGQLNYRDG